MPKKQNETENKQNSTIPKIYPAWFYGILIIQPVLFFVLLEAGLRFAGYGKEYKIFNEISSSYPGMLFLDRDVLPKYFTSIASPPSTIPDGFRARKKEGSYRVFVLGESSTAGWPYIANASFPRYIKRRLELFFPEKEIEVVNLGVAAICSYTVRDFAKELVKHSPDLVIIYTGHNEFYGALGVASTQSLGQSRTLINLLLSLQNIRIVQLLQDIIKTVWGAFGSSDADSEKQNETLMARVIGESSIPYGSETYHKGLEQFEGNMRDILELFRENNIPIIFGTVVSNLKDQKPFVSVQGADKSADELFRQAGEKLEKGDTISAKRLYYEAKDYDALRFRASSDLNNIIKKLCLEYSAYYADIDSTLNAVSPQGIVGSNLMVDHLHPNTQGYSLIGKTFYSVMEKYGLLPSGKKEISDTLADSLLESSFPFTSLDSVIARLRLNILLGAYPFVPRGTPNMLVANFKPSSLQDTLAMQVIDNIITWESAHYKMAERYWTLGLTEEAVKEINVLVEDRPINPENHKNLVSFLVESKQLEKAIVALHRMNKITPNDFSTKWLGSVYLQLGDVKRAIEYLEKSVAYNSADPQVWYNLSGAYFRDGNINKAYTAIKRCLKINPQNKLAIGFYQQLRQSYGLTD